MVSNPLSEERLQQLQDDGQEFLEEFGTQYSKCTGLAMFEKIQEDMEKTPESTDKRLIYRPWTSSEKQSLFRGAVYMKKGGGPGNFGKWKKVYLVERQDCNIDVFSDEKAYNGGKKTRSTIMVAGYKVTRDVTNHYKWSMGEIGAALGLTETEVNVLCRFSRHSWALTHDQRKNYIFQLHKGTNPLLPCLGANATDEEDEGDVADEGSGRSATRDEWIDFFKRCKRSVCPRDLESVPGQAFQLTVNRMTESMPRLNGFKDDGKESEMLVDMLMEHCLTPLRDGILGDLVGPVSLRLIFWYKTRVVIQKSLKKILDPAWSQMQKKADAIAKKIEPVVMKGLKPIYVVKADVKKRITAAVVDKMGQFLAETVTPYIKPVLKSFDKPLSEGFVHGQSTFDKYVSVRDLPTDAEQRNNELDSIARAGDNVDEMRKAARKVVRPLQELKALCEQLFQDLEPDELQVQAEELLLTTLDAAIYTLELKVDELGKCKGLKAKVIADYEYDVEVAKAEFVKKVARDILLAGFKRAISPVTDPIVDGFNDLIPDDMQDFLNVQALFDEIVDLFVGEPIDTMVDAAYPRPS